MHNKETIYEQLKIILAELFDIEPDAVSPQSKLYEDLDIDSIDAFCREGPRQRRFDRCRLQ
jgi:acyl carrier protein